MEFCSINVWRFASVPDEQPVFFDIAGNRLQVGASTGASNAFPGIDKKECTVGCTPQKHVFAVFELIRSPFEGYGQVGTFIDVDEIVVVFADHNKAVVLERHPAGLTFVHKIRSAKG